MTGFDTAVFLLLTIAPGVLIIAKLWAVDRLPLVSPTIIFVLGLIMFQSVSPYISMSSNWYYNFDVRDPWITSWKFVGYLSLFYAVFFLVSVRKRALGLNARRMLAGDWTSPRRSSVAFLACAFVSIGWALTMTGRLPLGALAHLFSLSAFGALGVSSVFAGVWLGKSKESKLFALVGSGLVVAIAAYLSFDGVFGRRPMLGVLLGFLYGYMLVGRSSGGGDYKKARRYRSYILYITVALTIFITLAAVSGSRTHQSEVLEGAQRIDVSLQSINRGIGLMMAGQDTGAASMWIIENYPKNVSGQLLGSLIYAIVYPAPRDLWPGKPIPLSSSLHYEAGFRRWLDDTGSTRGPGIVGHGVAEGGAFTLTLYALLLGLLFKWLDAISMGEKGFPLTVALGATMGYFLGFARGDLGSAIWRWAFMFTAAWLLTVAMLRLLRQLSGSRKAHRLPSSLV